MSLYSSDIERYRIVEGRDHGIHRLFHFAFRKRQESNSLLLRALFTVIVRLSLLFSASYIPRFCCGEGLCFPHLYGIVISYHSRIGSNVTIYQGVTIGQDRVNHPGNAPVIGNNVLIGAGAKIIGPVTIGDNVRIGANCVVVTDIPDNVTVVLEKPRIIIRT